MIRGEVDQFGNYTGIGYWWRRHYPTHIGFIRNERLEGFGLRIIHSKQKTMGLLIGRWENGWISGPGISISETGRLVGFFGSYKQNKFPTGSEKIQSYEKTNSNYLDDIRITHSND